MGLCVYIELYEDDLCVGCVDGWPEQKGKHFRNRQYWWLYKFTALALEKLQFTIKNPKF